MTADRVFVDRAQRARDEMAAAGVDVLLLSVGPDLPYLTGLQAMPLERLTMLVLPRDGEATLVIPRLEAPRVVERPEVFSLLPWGETEDPIAIVAGLAKGASVAAVGDHTWARFVVDLLAPAAGHHVPARASVVTAPLRMPQGRRRDRRAARGRRGRRPGRRPAAGRARSPLVGRTEADVSPDISRRLLAEGHDKVNFAIVAAGANAASPHHHAGRAGHPPRRGRAVRLRRHAWTATAATSPAACRSASRRPRWPRPTPCCHEAQQAAVAAAVVGTPCEEVDAVARRIIAAAGYGELLHPPHRPRHRHGGARGPLHRGGQRAAAGARATPSASSRASTARPVGHAPRGHRGGHRRPVPTP